VFRPDMQAVLHFALIGDDATRAIQEHGEYGDLELLPEGVAIRHGEERLAFGMGYEDGPSNVNASFRRAIQLADTSIKSSTMLLRPYRGGSCQARKKRVPEPGPEWEKHA